MDESTLPPPWQEHGSTDDAGDDESPDTGASSGGTTDSHPTDSGTTPTESRVPDPRPTGAGPVSAQSTGAGPASTGSFPGSTGSFPGRGVPPGPGATVPPTAPLGGAGGTTGPLSDGSAPSGTPNRLADFFDQFRRLGLARPTEGRWIGGVCAAAARRWGWDPALVRAAAVVVTLIGLGPLIYGLAWALLPEEDGRIHLEQAIHGDVTLGLVGAGVFAICDLGPIGWSGFGGPFFWFPLRGLGVLILIGLVLWWIFGGRHRRYGLGPGGRPPTPGGGWHGRGWHGGDGWQGPGAPSGQWQGPGAPSGQWQGPDTGGWRPTAGGDGRPTPGAPVTGDPAMRYREQVRVARERELRARAYRREQQRRYRRRASHALTLTTLGLALVSASIAGLWYDAHSSGGSLHTVVLATALATVAFGIVVAGIAGRRSGGLAPISVLLALGLVTSFSVGDRTWHPAPGVTSPRFELAAGEAVLDLDRYAAVRPGTPSSEIHVSIGAGRLSIRVPAGLTVQIHADLGAGRLESRTALGADRISLSSGGGLSRDLVVGPAMVPAVTVDAELGVGSLDIVGSPVQAGVR